jgi:hypothetical protein
MTVAKIAEDWSVSVSVERVEQILEWTFGERRQDPGLLVDFTPSAALALERFWKGVAAAC